MNGYELAELLRTKVTITNAMQAADKLVELEDALKKKTGKKNESKPSSEQSEIGISPSAKAVNNYGFESDPS